jgi:ABC-type phosphate transport system substrate-binding protein
MVWMRKLLSLSDLHTAAVKFLIPILAFAVLNGFSLGAAELAVVVNKANTLETIGSADLRLMILGEKTKWPDGKKVMPVQTSLESPEGALLLKVVFKMSEAVLKRYYMQAAFTGKDIVPPADVRSAAALKQFVARTPGAIGCILATDVDATVTVLKVDGAAPGEAGYKLH